MHRVRQVLLGTIGLAIYFTGTFFGSSLSTSFEY